jgi:DNA-binding NarL/FixJ family response regulator
MDGALGAVRTIVEETATRVLALGVADRVDDVLACAEAGAAGYVTRDASLDELVAAVHATTHSELVIAPAMAAALLQRAGHLARARAVDRQPDVKLTAREIQIVALIDAGLSNKQIAARLSIELSTVKNHVHNILDKLDVTRRNDAAAVVRTHLRI